MYWQNIVTILLSFRTLSESRKYVPHVPNTMPFGQYVIQLGHCMLGCDLANLEVLHVSRAVDHFLQLSLNGLNTRFCCRSACSASLFGWFLNWWINFWTVCLRMWSCSWTVECENPWSLESISPRQVSLYVPPCLSEWSKDFLASELMVSWRL